MQINLHLRVNDQILAEEVYVMVDDRLRLLARDEALALARSRGLDLVDPGPPPPPGSVPICQILALPRPLIWEALPGEATPPPVDPDLWFQTSYCSERHYLLGNAQTFPGRMRAWCPREGRSHHVSRVEIQECSRETSYYIQGYLAGQEPAAPQDLEGDPLPLEHPDQQAWIQAALLFTESGCWNESFRLCQRCQARLLPSNPGLECRSGACVPPSPDYGK